MCSYKSNLWKKKRCRPKTRDKLSFFLNIVIEVHSGVIDQGNIKAVNIIPNIFIKFSIIITSLKEYMNMHSIKGPRLSEWFLQSSVVNPSGPGPLLLGNLEKAEDLLQGYAIICALGSALFNVRRWRFSRNSSFSGNQWIWLIRILLKWCQNLFFILTWSVMSWLCLSRILWVAHVSLWVLQLLCKESMFVSQLKVFEKGWYYIRILS